MNSSVLSADEQQNNAMITDLPETLLIYGCQYLGQGDIYNFTEVNKYFHKIGMNPNSLCQLSLDSCCIKGIRLIDYTENQICTNINLSQQLSKQLQCLSLDNRFGICSNVIQHRFENLTDISVNKAHVNAIMNKIDDNDKLKLRRLELTSCVFDASAFKSVLNCRNLQQIIIRNIICGSRGFKAQIEMLIEESKRNKHLFSMVKSISFDIPTIVILKSFFYHLFLCSNNPALTIYGLNFGVNSRRLHRGEYSQLFSFDDEYKKKNEIFFSNLKQLCFHIDYDFGWLLVAKNISQWLDSNEEYTLDMFEVVIEDQEFMSHFVRQYPINSINVWEELDSIVRNSKNSRLEIVLEDFAEEFFKFIWQLFVDGNKQCFKEVKVTDNFYYDYNVHHSLLNEYTVNGRNFDKDAWGQKMANEIWEDRVKAWTQVVNTNVSKIRKLDVTIYLLNIDALEEDFEESNENNLDFIGDVVDSLIKYLEEKLAGYNKIKFSFDKCIIVSLLLHND